MPIDPEIVLFANPATQPLQRSNQATLAKYRRTELPYQGTGDLNGIVEQVIQFHCRFPDCLLFGVQERGYAELGGDQYLLQVIVENLG